MDDRRYTSLRDCWISPRGICSVVTRQGENERASIFFKVIITRDVLFWNPQFADRYEGGELLRPFDGDILDRHPFEIYTELHLNIELVGTVFRLGNQRGPINVVPRC